MPLVQTTPYNISPLTGFDNFENAVYLGFTRYNSSTTASGSPIWTPEPGVSMSSTTDAQFKDDGTIVYMSDNNGDRIWQHQLNTPYDGTTIRREPTWVKGVGGQTNQAYGIAWQRDGSILYIGDRQSDNIIQYDPVAGNWDATGAVYEGGSPAPEFSVNGAIPGARVRSIDMPKELNNTRMFVTDTDAVALYEFSFGTIGDVRTLSHVQTSTTFSADMASFAGIRWRPNGKMLFAVERTARRIHQYTLSTAWDISTLTHVTFVSVPPSTGEYAQAVEFNPDGTRMEVMTNAGFRSFSIALPS